MKLVSRQFRKQRLAVWAAGRGPDPSFTAMVFEACDRVLGPGLPAAGPIRPSLPWCLRPATRSLRPGSVDPSCAARNPAARRRGRKQFGSWQGSAERQAKSRFAATFASLQEVTFVTVDRWLKKTKASVTRMQARWKLAVLFVQWCPHVPPFPPACASGIVCVLFFDLAINLF